MPSAIRKKSSSAATAATHSNTKQDDASNDPERRKLRNRMSQRAFRARQAMRIQELEGRLEHTSASDATWVTELQDQNARLREQLLHVHKKAIGMQISLKALADAAAQALGIDKVQPVFPSSSVNDNSEQPSSASEHVDSPPSDSTIEIQRSTFPAQPTEASELFADLMQTTAPDVAADTAPVAPMVCSEEPPMNGQFIFETPNLDYFASLIQNTSEDHEETGMTDSPGGLGEMSGHFFTSAPPQHVSLISLPTTQTGPEQYKDLTERASALCSDVQTLKKTNSRFSDHIDAFELCLKTNCSRDGQMVMAKKTLLNAIEFMITAFVNISWTRMMAWETYTRSLTALKDLTAWRMDRTTTNWLKIVPQYRPTKLQISVAHPSVIDWIPWPSLRDKLIIHHAANPKLDDVISDVGKAYVVQADLSTLVRCPQPIIGYVPVWTLVQAISAGEVQDVFPDSFAAGPIIDKGNMSVLDDDIVTSQTPSQRQSLPASSVNELFGSASLARAAHQLLGIGQGAAFNYRLDPAFFEVYPELYDPEANVIAQGVRLRPNNHFVDEPYPIPGELDTTVLTQYRDISRIALNCVAV